MQLKTSHNINHSGRHNPMTASSRTTQTCKHEVNPNPENKKKYRTQSKQHHPKSMMLLNAKKHQTYAFNHRVFPGHAMSLNVRKTALLKICNGRAWVTLGNIKALQKTYPQDYFIDHGQTLRIPAGTRLVIEPVSRPDHQDPVSFELNLIDKNSLKKQINTNRTTHNPQTRHTLYTDTKYPKLHTNHFNLRNHLAATKKYNLRFLQTIFRLLAIRRA